MPLATASLGDTRIDRSKANSVTTSPAKKKVAEATAAKAATSPLPRKVGLAAKTVPAQTPDLVSERTPAQKEHPIASGSGSVGGQRPVATKAKEGKTSSKEIPGRNTSPAKRSPLAPSPAATAAESASVASTPKTLTSVGTVSTPSRSPSYTITVASGTAAVRPKPRYAQETAATSTKRKADRIEEAAAAPPSKRRNFPDASTIRMAKKFKDEWKRYKEMYEEAQNASDPHHSEKMNRVLKMHKDLTAMKARLVSLSAS